MARRTKDEAEKTRHTILDAAEKVFFKRGVTRTSLEEIAKEAGVTRGAVYWHFKDKIELCEAMMERIFLPQEEILESLTTGLSSQPLEDLKNSCLGCLKQMATDKQRQRVMSVLLFRCEYVEEMAGFLKRRNRAKDRMLERTRILFERAHKLHSLAPGWTPRTASITFQAVMNGLITSALEGRKDFDLAKSGVACLEAFFFSLERKT